MKTNNIFLISLLLSVFLFSCSDDKEKDSGVTPEPTENETINRWIHAEMSFRYYWNEHVPSIDELKSKLELEPDQFYYYTLYRYNEGRDYDRFSYLENNGIDKIPVRPQSRGEVKTSELGFEFYTLPFRDIGLAYCVVYVKPDTEAATKLKRGDIIYRVDNTRITEQNYWKLLDSGKSQYKLELYGQNKTVTLNTTKDYAEHPLLLHRVIEEGGKKIGYMVYNFFANDMEDDSNSYAIDVNNAFADFKAQNITDLVLDLRYNPGGYVISGNYIASAIVRDRGTNAKKVYTKREYNKEFDLFQRTRYNTEDYEKDVTEFFQDKIKNGRKSEDVTRLEMQNLYVITSEYTASASEQIINGLSPYLNVNIIGETTMGKNMESYKIPDPEGEIKWALHPLTSKSFNSEGFGDYNGGFEPTIGTYRNGEYRDSEFKFHQGDDGVATLYPLGDPREALLSIAIEHITGKRTRITKGGESVIQVSPIGSSIERERSEMIISPRQ